MKAVAIATMTPEEIRNRLSVLSELEAEHEARDLDAELAKALREGGDVDALETAHLDAERAARRLRVERSALTAELPEAERREGERQISDLASRHGDLARVSPEKADRLMRAWSTFQAALTDWNSVQDEASNLTRRAAGIANKTGAVMPNLGTFQSARVSSVLEESREVWRTLTPAADFMQTVAGLQGHRID